MRTRIASALSVLVLLRFVSPASADVIITFPGSTDEGFGHAFASSPYDPSETFPIVNIGGTNYMEVLDDGDFHEAERASDDPLDPFYQTMLAASSNEAAYMVCYEWYVDTGLSPGNYGTFLEIGMYVNTGNGFYTQDFPGVGKDVSLSGAQLASGGVFSGSVMETFTAKGVDMPLSQTLFRLGFIINGDGSQAKVYIGKLSVTEVVPEPASLVLMGLAAPALMPLTRRPRRRRGDSL